VFDIQQHDQFHFAHLSKLFPLPSHAITIPQTALSLHFALNKHSKQHHIRHTAELCTV